MLKLLIMIYYASIATGDEQTIEKITKSIERMSTVSGADIRAVLYAAALIIKSITQALALGKRQRSYFLQ